MWKVISTRMDYTAMRLMRIIKCPICGKDVKLYEKVGARASVPVLPPNFPFCSRRCKLIDLGKWLNEEYKISEPLPEGYVPADDES